VTVKIDQNAKVRDLIEKLQQIEDLDILPESLGMVKLVLYP